MIPATPRPESEPCRGLVRFILLRGVLGWGVPTAVLFAVLMVLFGEPEGFGVHLGRALMAFPPAGVFFGAWLWRRSQR